MKTRNVPIALILAGSSVVMITLPVRGEEPVPAAALEAGPTAGREEPGPD